MSNILDALRKAQSEQKSAPVKPATATDPLLSHRPIGSGRGAANRRAVIIGCCGLFVLAIVAWLLYGPSKKSSELTQALPAPPVAQPREPLAQPQQPPPPLQPQEQQSPQASATAPPPPAPPAAPEKQEPAVTGAQAPPAPANGGEAGSTRRRKSRRLSPQVAQTAPVESATVPEPQAQTVTATAGNPDGIKLTGIAWQSSRKLRRAVINDLLVGEGASVAGAKVLEIKQNSVKLEKGGLVYEVMLLK